MHEVLQGLNPEQRAAVTLPPQHALILAGAGSGKTRVLTSRIAWLLETGEAGPHEIMAVTFTNKAAREMASRLAELLPEALRPGLRRMWVGTFHALANRLLRIHHQAAGLPQMFQILDTADQLSAIKRLLKRLNVSEQSAPPRELLSFINAHKEQGLRPDKVAAESRRAERFLPLWQEYEAQCQREGVVDFAELLLRSDELLARDEALRAHYRARFRHVLVDEFQDTNALQYRWLQRFAADPVTGEAGAFLFCVGDDDQSIYGFRGALARNLMRFEQEFRVQAVIRLERNYRSHGNILEAANAIIAHNRERLGKNLWTEAGEGEPIRVFQAPDDGAEARFVAEEIGNLLREGVSADEIAVLYRANAQSRALEHALVAAGIPYRVHGGQRFFDRAEIKHALAYLRLLLLPDDETAFLRVVNFPPRGIGARTLEALAAQRDGQTDISAAATRLAGRPGAALQGFLQLIERLREQTREVPLPELVERVIAGSGLRTHYAAERDGGDRLENLDELVSAASDFVAQMASEGIEAQGHEMLALFLQHAALESGEQQAEAGQTAVQLMTVHASKGLEFDVVFLTGLEEGLFPHQNSLYADGGVEEERRLMYVAVTRAKKRLYLSWSDIRMLHGQTEYHQPSRFLEEIPPELLLWLNAKRRERKGGDLAPSRVTAVPQSSSGAANGWRSGERVRHPKFGEGVILAVEGAGAHAQASVKFGPEVGVKQLLLSVAPLERL